MQIDLEIHSEASIVTVQDKRIVAACAIEFKDRMQECTAKSGARIILDLTHVDFVDSSGLGAIVASMKQLNEGQVLELANLSPTVEKVFHLTRMDTVFTIHGQIDDLIEGSKKSA